MKPVEDVGPQETGRLVLLVLIKLYGGKHFVFMTVQRILFSDIYLFTDATLFS